MLLARPMFRPVAERTHQSFRPEGPGRPAHPADAAVAKPTFFCEERQVDNRNWEVLVSCPDREIDCTIGFDSEDAAAHWMINQLSGADAWAARPKDWEDLRRSTVSQIEANQQSPASGTEAPDAGVDRAIHAVAGEDGPVGQELVGD